jgi:hypothetical protein
MGNQGGGMWWVGNTYLGCGESITFSEERCPSFSGTPGRSNELVINPVAMENTPTCALPTGTTRCSLPVVGVAFASANGYGAGSLHPSAARAPYVVKEKWLTSCVSRVLDDGLDNSHHRKV